MKNKQCSPLWDAGGVAAGVVSAGACLLGVCSLGACPLKWPKPHHRYDLANGCWQLRCSCADVRLCFRNLNPVWSRRNQIHPRTSQVPLSQNDHVLSHSSSKFTSYHTRTVTMRLLLGAVKTTSICRRKAWLASRLYWRTGDANAR